MLKNKKTSALMDFICKWEETDTSLQKKEKESVYVRQDKCYGGKKTCIDSEHT